MADLSQSQLPQEPEYWDELAAKVREDAAGPLAAYRADDETSAGVVDDGWYGVLAQRAPWLVAASVAAMVILWLVLPARPPSAGFRWIEGSLTPSEMAGSLVSGATPPSVDLLMVHFPPDEGQR